MYLSNSVIIAKIMTDIISELIQKPFVQVISFIILTILVICIIGPKNTDNTWSLAGYFFFGFMLLNSVLLWNVSNSWSYFFYSLGFSILYLVSISVIIPGIIKIAKIDGSAESAMIFIYIIYHPVLLLVVLFAKWAYLKLF